MNDTEKFHSRVAHGEPDECWEWTAGRWPGQEYGRIKFYGRDERAHRIAWELEHGPIPEGMFVCHRCDNPPCCNPAHLFLGTPADNMADMARKGRSLHSHRNPRSRLTADQVDEVRRLYAAGTITQAVLGKQFGVSQPAISAVVRQQVWDRGAKHPPIKVGKGGGPPRRLKTHCGRGHPLTGDNVIQATARGRRCRACARLTAKRRYAAKRSAAPTAA